MTQGGKPIQISVTLETGTADSVRQIRVLGWTGSAVMCSRSQYESIRKRDDFNRPGVYVLVGPGNAKDQRQQIYIGQTNAAGERIDNHRGRKDFWTDLVLFTTGDGSFNSAHFRHIEQKLYSLATAAGRAYLLNGNKPGGAYLSAADTSAADDFLDRMLIVYPLLGIAAFEPSHPTSPLPPVITPPAEVDGRELWSMDTMSCDATAYRDGKAFLVLKDSVGRLENAPSLSEPNRRRRQRLIDEGVLKAVDGKLVLTQDYHFGSPSGAAVMLAGVATNGLRAWRNAAGISMEDAEAPSARLDTISRNEEKTDT